jgi:hypothetical protein
MFLPVTIASLIALGPGMAPSSAAQVATSPPGSRSDWRDVAPEALGPVRPLLVDRPELRVQPTRHVAFKREAIGEPGAIVALSATPHLAFLAFRAGTVELRTLHRESGEISEPLMTLSLRERPTAFLEGPDGTSVLVRATDDSSVTVVDVPSGKVRRILTPPEAGPGRILIIDHETFAVAGLTGTIRLHAIAGDGPATIVQLPPIFPFAAGKGQIIGHLHMDPPSAPGQTVERRMVVASYDARSGKETGRIDLVAGPSAAGANADLLAFGEVDPAWKAFRTLDPVTLAERARLDMSPQVQSLRLEISADGRYLAMLEYIAQPIVFWDTSTGAAAAVIGPERGGYLTYDLSDDGKVLGGIVGPWVEGKIVVDAFEWTDLTQVKQLTKTPPAAATGTTAK